MPSLVSCLNPAQLQRDLGVRDLSDPTEGPHAIQIPIGRAVEEFCRAWNCEVRWCRGPRIVPVADNYDRLGYVADAITRDARYTRYVDAGHMLRSHASAMIPPALRRLTRQPGDDVLLACPGMVYRRDAIDWQHTGTPHQLDLWRITRRAVSGTDLDQMPIPACWPPPDSRDGQGLPSAWAWTGCSCWPRASPTSGCSAPAIPGSAARCSSSPDTSMSPRCRRSPGTCPSPSPQTTTRKLSAAGSAMPSAPTRAAANHAA